MKCLLPVVPLDADDRARLLAPLRGEPLFLHAARTLAGHPGLSPLLVTSDRDVATLARPVLPVLELPGAAAREHDRPLPPGTRDCLTALLPRDMDPDAPLLVCDCRHPFLDGSLADQARAAWDGQRPLIGVRPPEDHPVQLQAHYLLRFADALVRLDPAGPDLPELDRLARRMTPQDAPRPAAFVTRPMAVDWAGHGIGTPDKGGPYVLVRGEGERPWTALAPLDDVPQSPDAACSIAAAFVQPGTGSARRLLFPRDPAPAALSFLGGEAPDCLGLRENGETRLYLRADLWLEGALLKFAPFAGLRPLPMAAASLWLGDPARAPRRLWAGREYAAPEIVLPDEADGALVALQTPAFGNEATHTEFAFPDTPLWSFDPARRACVDRSRGEPIVGRQLFPEIYESCTAIVLARSGELAGLREDSPLAGLALKPPYALACDSPLGLCRCLLQAEEQEERP